MKSLPGHLAEVMEKISHERPAEIFLGFARFPVARLADPRLHYADSRSIS